MRREALRLERKLKELFTGDGDSWCTSGVACGSGWQHIEEHGRDCCLATNSITPFFHSIRIIIWCMAIQRHYFPASLAGCGHASWVHSLQRNVSRSGVCHFQVVSWTPSHSFFYDLPFSLEGRPTEWSRSYSLKMAEPPPAWVPERLWRSEPPTPRSFTLNWTLILTITYERNKLLYSFKSLNAGVSLVQ